MTVKNKTIVLGLGNPLMSDEGIGIVIVNKLSELMGNYPSVDFVDAGTGGMNLLHLFDGRDKAVLIDCAYMEEKPGQIRKFVPQEVKSVKQLAHQSLHEQDILKIIEMATQFGSCPREIIIFGIQPEKVSLGQGISSILAVKIADYIKMICNELD